MVEIQYNVMDLPAFVKSQNKIILGWVYTNMDWRRPNECLKSRGSNRERMRE